MWDSVEESAEDRKEAKWCKVELIEVDCSCKGWIGREVSWVQYLRASGEEWSGVKSCGVAWGRVEWYELRRMKWNQK